MDRAATAGGGITSDHATRATGASAASRAGGWAAVSTREVAKIVRAHVAVRAMRGAWQGATLGVRVVATGRKVGNHKYADNGN